MYAAFSLIIFSALAAAAYWTLAFLLSTFNSVIFTDTKDTKPEVSSFDLPLLEVLAPRFGIVVPDGGLSMKMPVVAPPLPPPSPSPAPIAVSSQAPAPMPTPNRTEFSISILNGTGINGLAGKWKKHFLAEGFSNTTAANARQKDILGTELKYRASSTPALPAIREILQQNGAIITRETKEEVISSDVEITIGK